MGLIAYKPDDLLILDSDLIITGTVSRIGESKWSNPDFYRGDTIPNYLQTDIYIAIEEILYGESETDTIAVRVDYGEDETTIVRSDGYPDFTIGEQVLLFLGRDTPEMANGEDYYMLVGLDQGKFNLQENTAAQSGSLADSANTDTASADNARYVNLEYPEENRAFTIGELKTRIAAEHAARPNYRAERAAKQAEIRERNKALFGE